MSRKVVMTLAAIVLLCRGASAGICVDCHQTVTPNIVTDWQLSKHSKNEVDCSTCHGEGHRTAQDVGLVQIPTPETCAGCHAERVAQFKAGKHAFAWAAMNAMPTAHWQPMAMMEGMKGCGGCHKIGLKTADEIVALKKSGSAGFGDARDRDALQRSRRLPPLPGRDRVPPLRLY